MTDQQPANDNDRVGGGIRPSRSCILTSDQMRHLGFQRAVAMKEETR